MIARDSRPRLAPGVRLRPDRVGGQMMLLSPERGLALDAIGTAILALCTGEHAVGEIAGSLHARYLGSRAQIERDVLEFLSALEARRLVRALPPREAP